MPMSPVAPDASFTADSGGVSERLRGVPVVVFASATWESPHPVNAHQIARRLAAHGNPVLFVESTGLRLPRPFSSGHDLTRILRRVRDAVRGVREVAQNLHVASPIALPGATSGWLRRLSLWAIAWQTGRASRRLGFSRPIFWSFLPSGFRVIPSVQPRLSIYQCVDQYSANPGVDSEWVDTMEARILEQVDLVLATSSPLADRLGTRRPDVHLVENVADVEMFSRAALATLAEPQDLQGLRRPRAIYMGNLARYRIEMGWVESLARSMPELEVVLVGATGMGERDGRELEPLPNLHQLGARPQEDLPAFLAHCDVALLPFQDNAHTRACFPLKLWEYAAAGLPIVSRDLPCTTAIRRELQGVWPAKDFGEFVNGVREALAEPRAARAIRSEVAQGHGWEGRMAELYGVLARGLESKLVERGGGSAPRPGCR